MITPAEIKARAVKIWQSGRLLSAQLRQEELFPLDIPFRKATAKEALGHCGIDVTFSFARKQP